MESLKSVKTEITDMFDQFPQNIYFVFNTRNSEELLLYSKHADRLLPTNLQRLLSPLFLNASVPSKVRNIGKQFLCEKNLMKTKIDLMLEMRSYNADHILNQTKRKQIRTILIRLFITLLKRSEST